MNSVLLFSSAFCCCCFYLSCCDFLISKYSRLSNLCTPLSSRKRWMSYVADDACSVIISIGTIVKRLWMIFQVNIKPRWKEHFNLSHHFWFLIEFFRHNISLDTLIQDPTWSSWKGPSLVSAKFFSVFECNILWICENVLPTDR